jgi:hypothetical protein
MYLCRKRHLYICMYAKCLPKEVNNAYVFTQLVLKVNRYCTGGFTYISSTVLYILLTYYTEQKN